MKSFREETRDGSSVYVGGLSTPERLVLAQVTGDVVELLGGDDGFIDLEATLDMVGPDGASAHQVLRARLAAEESGDSEADLESHLRELFEGVDEQIVSAPSDPAVRRLLPDASDDEAIALEFRRLTDDDLRRRKVDRLLRFADLLLDAAPSRDEDEQLPFVVKAIDGAAIAGALGDIRQVIGTRLELADDADTEALYDVVASTWDEQAAGPEFPDSEPTKPPAHAAPPRRTRETMSGSDLFLGSVFVLAGFLQESLTDCLLHDFRHARRDG